MFSKLLLVIRKEVINKIDELIKEISGVSSEIDTINGEVV